MKTYALIAQGYVVNIIEVGDAGWPEGVDITGLEPHPGIGWQYDEETEEFIAPTYPEPEPAPEPDPEPEKRIISNLAFDLRFTFDERLAIEMASLDDPSKTVEQRTLAAALRVSKERANKALFTDLDNQTTRDSVFHLESAGLIEEGRALEILDAPIVEGEKPWNV